MTSTSFPFEAIGSHTTGAILGSHTSGAILDVCNGTAWMDGVGVGVQSMTSTSFRFEAIGKQGLEHGISTGSHRTGATGAFLGVCNGAACMDGVGIGVLGCSGGAASVSVSFVTEKAIWN